MKTKAYPSQEIVKSLFDYHEGLLFWRERDKFENRDEVAGYTHKESGYVHVTWKGQTWKVHRLIWIWHHGDIPEDLTLDHINRVRNDNRIENLRLVTHSDNQVNKASAGVKGISYHKRDNRWQASIKVDNKRVHLGYFKTPEEAHAAFLKAELHFRGYNSD